MAVTSQTGKLSFGAQSAKESYAATFYQHLASGIDLSAFSDDRLGDPEVGGVSTPTIPYRAGVMATGGATINPRLEDTFGWLLHGLSGAWSVTADEDVFGTTETGFQHHEFTFASDEGYVPYMTFRKEIPAVASTEYLGEIYGDCKILNAAFALPNDNLISARVDVLGRAADTLFDDNPSFSYDNTQMESYVSVPIGCTVGGYLKVPSFSANALPVTQATIVFQNQPLDVRQEKNFGSPYLDEVTIVGRQMMVDMILKWKDPQLYLDILTGSTTGTVWNSSPYVNDLDIYALSPDPIVGTTPYQIRFQAPELMYQIVGGIELAGNQAVMMRVRGTAIANTQYYYTIHLGNEQTAYTWPT